MATRAPLSIRIERRSSQAAIHSQVYENFLVATNSGIKPFAQLEWPNPERGKSPSIALKTWQDGPRLNLIGKDQFFSAPGQPLTYDWQNPRGKSRGISLLTEVYSPLLTTLQVVFTVPFLGFTFENPRKKPTNQSHLDSVKLNLLGKDLLFGAPGQPVTYDWPLPKAKQPSVSLKSETFSPLLTTLSVVLQMPYNQYQWPVPRGRLPGVSLKTFTEPQKLLQIGKDVLYGAPGQTKTFDWPVPAGKRAGLSLKIFDQAPALNYAPVIIDTSNYVIVPYLIGDTEASARARIASIHCTALVIGSSGTVTAQNPAHMSLVARATVVSITLGGIANNPPRNRGWPSYGSSVH